MRARVAHPDSLSQRLCRISIDGDVECDLAPLCAAFELDAAEVDVASKPQLAPDCNCSICDWCEALVSKLAAGVLPPRLGCLQLGDLGHCSVRGPSHRHPFRDSRRNRLPRSCRLSDESRHLLMGLASVVQNLDCGSLPETRGAYRCRPRPSPDLRWPHALDQTHKPASANAIAVRSLFKHAADPNKFLFDDIPRVALASDADGASTESVIGRLQEGLEELTRANGQMLDRLRNMMLAEFQVPDSPQALADLRARAENVLHLSGDFHINALVGRLTTFKEPKADMEGIAALLARKPSRDWVDADLDQASIELVAYCQEFIRLESLARVKGRPDKRHAMAVVIGIHGRPAPVSGQFDITDHERADVDMLVEKLTDAISSSLPRNLPCGAR